jgi:hypothetical protein
MKKTLFALMTGILAIAFCSAQTSKPDAPKSQACVIVKRHVPKFGENMSRVHPHQPFDYVEGAYPSGCKWRSELGDSDVRDVQKKGGKVVVMRPDYEAADLEDARKQCQSHDSPPAK